MICPNCSVQMHQKEKLGGGVAEPNKYETWEVKECPSCDRLVKEFYSAEVISKTKVARMIEESDADIIYDDEEQS